VMPWVWQCLYKTNDYIAQTFHAGYVFYGHLWLDMDLHVYCQSS